MSFGFCLDPPQLRQQLARGSKSLRGKFPATAVARAAEPPAVALSSPPGHLLGAVKPRVERHAHDERAAAGPQTNSVDQHRDKPQQTNDPSAHRGDRQTPCKTMPSDSRGQSLHTREVVGSNPTVPIRNTCKAPSFWICTDLSRQRERSPSSSPPSDPVASRGRGIGETGLPRRQSRVLHRCGDRHRRPAAGPRGRLPRCTLSSDVGDRHLEIGIVGTGITPAGRGARSLTVGSDHPARGSWTIGFVMERSSGGGPPGSCSWANAQAAISAPTSRSAPLLARVSARQTATRPSCGRVVLCRWCLQPSESQLAVRALVLLVARMRVWRPRGSTSPASPAMARPAPCPGRSRCSYSPGLCENLTNGSNATTATPIAPHPVHHVPRRRRRSAVDGDLRRATGARGYGETAWRSPKG